jgi:hypothetical protein
MKLSDEHRANLLQHATKLYRMKTPKGLEFNMHLFTSDPIDEQHVCRTAACSLGWASRTIRPLNKNEIIYDDIGNWIKFGYNIFGIKSHMDEWKWMFSYDWTESDNTRRGAAQRILYYLRHGLPADWYAQMIGSTPLCYKKEKP